MSAAERFPLTDSSFIFTSASGVSAALTPEALEVLFRLEDTLGLEPVETKGGIAIAVSPDAPGAQKSAAALKAWKRMRDGLDAGDVSEDEHERWKASFKA